MTTSKISELQDSIDLTTIEILVPTMNKKNAIKYTIFDFRKIDIDKISNFDIGGNIKINQNLLFY